VATPLSINGAVEEDFRIPFSIPFGDVAGLRWWQLRLSINGAVREIFWVKSESCWIF
jgi:hypothetical protein